MTTKAKRKPAACTPLPTKTRTYTPARLEITDQHSFPGVIDFASEEDDGDNSITCCGPNEAANARRAVVCWNSHDKLISALKRLLAEADDDGITQDGVDAAFAALREAGEHPLPAE